MTLLAIESDRKCLMIPTLKKLSKPGISAKEVVELLHRHIGPHPSNSHCRQAIDALATLRNPELRKCALTISRICDDPDQPCAVLDRVIDGLKSLEEGRS